MLVQKDTHKKILLKNAVEAKNIETKNIEAENAVKL